MRANARSKQAGVSQPKAVIDRLGKLSGRYAGEPGASISARGMPPGSGDLPYTKFEVLKPIPMEYGPASGVPKFAAKGGATQ